MVSNAGQPPLFFDSPKHAISCTIEFSDKTFEQVAHHLWPTKPLRTAYARLKNCLNDDKDEKLDFAEIIEVCRFCDRFDALYYFAEQCSHTRPLPVVRDNEKVRVQKQFIAAVDQLEKIKKDLAGFDE